MIPDPFNPSFEIEERTTRKLVAPATIVTAYTDTIRSKFANIGATQAEAYKQVEAIAYQVVAGEASADDEAYLKARDVDAQTINPATGNPVADVMEAAQVIIATAQMWYSVLKTTEVARKQAISQLGAMSPTDIPHDLNTWLADNFIWLPENLS